MANYLLVVLDQSLFTAHRSLTEYKAAQTQRSEILRTLLERAEISEDAVEVPVSTPV